MPLLLSQTRDHLVLCLFPRGQRPYQCLAATLSQPHQVPAPVRPCLNCEEPQALERLQVARERLRSMTSARESCVTGASRSLATATSRVNWVDRNPVGCSSSSKSCVTARAALRTFEHAHVASISAN